MVRLFVTTSHICTLYMLSYARSSTKVGYKDILVIDSPPKKNSLVKAIVDTQKIYPWAEIANLSTVMPEDTDFTISTRKNITQKLRTKFFVKPFYKFLLKIYFKQQQQKEAKIINSKLSNEEEVIEVNMLTQTMVNKTLFKLFPKAKVNYLEHGVGDYLFIQKMKPLNFDFYALFADNFKKYLTKEDQPHQYVKKLDTTHFDVLAKAVIDNDKNADKIRSLLKVEGKAVLILLENVHLYNVPDNYWTDYLKLCIMQIDNPAEYTFIIKPHPFQSFKSLEISKEFMINISKLKTIVVNEENSSNYSVEVLYSLWQNNVTHIFTVFSSGVFYISELYKNDKIKYYYAYDFFKLYYQNALPEYILKYNEFGPIIKNVFAKGCIDMAKQKPF